MGLVVVQDSVTEQLLAPAAMVHDGDVGVSVPVGARQELPFHVVPEAQLALAVRETSS
jgi:hypothetical protein